MIWGGAQAVMLVLGVAANTEEASLARPLLASCYMAQFLTGHGLLLVCDPEVGNPWSRPWDDSSPSLLHDYHSCFPWLHAVFKSEVNTCQFLWRPSLWTYSFMVEKFSTLSVLAGSTTTFLSQKLKTPSALSQLPWTLGQGHDLGWHRTWSLESPLKGRPVVTAVWPWEKW